MTPDGVYAAMRAVMADVSERAYCAGWMGGLEECLWQELERMRGGVPLRGYGMWEPDEPRLVAALTALDDLSRSVEGGAWLVWDWHHDDPFDGSAAAPRLVSWEEWLRWRKRVADCDPECVGVPSDHCPRVRA